MIKIAKRLEDIPEYVHLKLTREVKLVEEKTKRKVLHFGQGNPDFRPSEKYLQKLNEFFQDTKSHLYPGYTPIPAFTTGLQNWYQQRFDVTLEINEIQSLLGAKDGIAHLPLALFNEGDEILVPDPGYPSYTEPALLIGAKIVSYDLTEKTDTPLDFNNLEKKVTKKTKAMWVNFPSNPTGQTVTLADLEKLVAFAKKHNIIIFYDNVYSEITFGDYVAPSILQVKGAKDIAIELGSFSKMFSFAGFRMGWIVGNKEIIKALSIVKSQMDSGLSIPLQHLAAFTLQHPDQTWHKQMLTSYQTRRDIIAEHLKTLNLSFELPQAALYIWAKIPDKEKNAYDYCMKLLREKQILFTPGSAFGKNGERYVRVSYCANIDTIEDYFDAK